MSVVEKVHIPEVIEPDEKLPRDLVALRRFAYLMDEVLNVPGTKIRIGLDALLGLIPGLGDIIGGLMSTWIIFGALRHRVPARVIMRMVANIGIDVLFGAVPVAGDVFDFLFEENVKNMRLLEKHRDRRREPRSPMRIALATVAIGAFILFLSLAATSALVFVLFWLIGSRPWV